MEIALENIYATAMYQAACDIKAVDEVRKELVALDKIFRREEDFHEILSNPAISAEVKKGMIEKIFGGRILTEVLSFLYILVDKGRLFYFHGIVKQYCDILDRERGISEGVVYTTVPLTEDQLYKLDEEASKLIRKKVYLKNRIDKSILGGVKIFVDGKVIDASFKSRLDRLADIIKNQ